MELPRLTVAILTYQRPEQLVSTLRAVVRGIDEAADLVNGDVLVVDNDPEASAQSAISEICLPRVRYAHEPRPGIAAARNRALDECLGSGLLAFIDDDEIPEVDWLTALLQTRTRYGADAVAGRVIAELPSNTDPRIIAGGFFERPTRPTGTPLRAAATGNLLLDLDVVRETRVRFDETLGLGGGEDTIFTSQLVRAGARIVWCDESIATDRMPSDRVTWPWMRRRAFAHGNVLQKSRERLADGPFARTRIRVTGAVGGLGRIARGSAQWVWGVVARDLRHRARGERGVLRGGGVLAASLGIQHLEYNRKESKP